MSVVMKVANQGDINAHAVKLLPDVRNRLGRLGRVHGDADQLRPSHCQFLDLDGGANSIGGVGIGHGLNANWRVAAHCHDPCAPTHAGLPRTPGLRRSRLNGKTWIHYRTSKRATLFLVRGARSNGLPRTCTSVVSARPTITINGRLPDAPTVSPAPIVLRN